MDKKDLKVTTVITMVETLPNMTIADYEESVVRESEYIQEVKEYMEAAVDEETTVVTVEVTQEEC